MTPLPSSSNFLVPPAVSTAHAATRHVDHQPDLLEILHSKPSDPAGHKLHPSPTGTLAAGASYLHPHQSMGEIPKVSPPMPPSSSMITPGLASLTIGDHIPKKTRLSCFHYAGAETEASIRAELGKPMEFDIMAFYDEALSRLPIADMPELQDCVLSGGHCIGLLDPVSNIIFNALNLLCRRRCTSKSALPRRGRKRPSAARSGGTWITIVFRSYAGLVAFMRTYFRYLSTGQALRYLRLAGADLAVAVQLGEHQQFGPEDRHSPDLCCGRSRTQFALKVAAAIAGHPEPDDLARLAHSVAPFKDRKALAAVLQKGQLLTVDDVNSIVSSLQRQHYAASPAVQVVFLRRPHPDFDQGFGLPERRLSEFSVVGENYVADVSISRNDGAVSSICDLRTPDEMKQMLSKSLDLAATTIGKCCPPHMTRDLCTAPPVAATCECEHIRYLKLCLADTIHAFYIKALSLLPHNSLHKHLRGILVAGHCCGPMDPVSNIILNAIWYNTVCPLPEIDAEIEPDILDSKSLLRMEVRSLDGLVAMFCTATGLSEHDAVEYLCYKQCDLSVVLQTATKEKTLEAYDCAGQAGKHPNYSELASFLVTRCSNDIQVLRTLLTYETTGKSNVISDASLEKVSKIVGGQKTIPSVDRPRLCPMAWNMLGSRKVDFVQKQRFLRQTLDELLLDYSDQHPWEPTHRLDVICGAKKIKFEHSNCYHINFLAYCDDSASNVASARVLFFAEVWRSSSKAKPSKPVPPVEMLPVPCTVNGHRNESYSHAKLYCKPGQMKSQTSFCCPLPHYKVDCPYLGRCTICEPTSSKIVHPPSGKHAGANCGEIGDLLDYLNSVNDPASGVDCVTDSDFIYFDCLRDAKFAVVLNNGKPSLKMKKQIFN